MKKLLNDAHRGNIKRPSEAASADLLAFMAYYEHHVAQSQRNKVLDAQVRTFRHNREHYQKITANLLPVLSMLTSVATWAAACRPSPSMPTTAGRS